MSTLADGHFSNTAFLPTHLGPASHYGITLQSKAVFCPCCTEHKLTTCVFLNNLYSV